MTRSIGLLRSSIAGAVAAGVLFGLIASGSAWGQATDTRGKDKAPPPAPAAKDKDKAPVDPPKDAPKSPKDASQDTPKTPKDPPKESSKDSPSTTPKTPPRDNPRDSAKDEPARDRSKDTPAARDTKDPRDTKETRESARDPKDARDADRDSRDTRPDARTTDRTARDADRNLRDSDRNTRDTDRNRTDSKADVDAAASFRAANVRAADIGLWFDRSARDGLVISDIGSSGAITKLGFRTGDRIVSVNGQRVTREADFVQYLFADDVRNKRVEVIVLRDGREQVVMVEPAVLIEEYSYVENDPLENFGVIVDDRYTDRLVVWKVIPRSPAYYAGIRAGDTLVSYRGEKIPNIKEFTHILQTAEPGPVPLQVSRNQQVRQFEVDVPRYQARSRRQINYRTDTDILPGADRRQERREERGPERGANPSGVLPGARPR